LKADNWGEADLWAGVLLTAAVKKQQAKLVRLLDYVGVASGQILHAQHATLGAIVLQISAAHDMMDPSAQVKNTHGELADVGIQSQCNYGPLQSGA
jgi:hypothetical protein